MRALLFLFSISFFSAFGMIQKVDPVHIPERMKSYFTLEGRWENDFYCGWLKVPDIGKREVLIKLVGKSYYNPHKTPKDYRIIYIGHAQHGHKFDLPKGLYYWRAAGDTKDIPHVYPTKGNKYENKIFDWTGYYGPQLNKTCPSKWITSSEPHICWDPQKAKYVHPSQEIAELFEKLHQ